MNESNQQPILTREVVRTAPLSSATFMDRLLFALSNLTRPSYKGGTPASYESSVHTTDDEKRHLEFVEFMRHFVGEKGLDRFSQVPHEIAYNITPMFTSVVITGILEDKSSVKPNELPYHRLVFNFTTPYLNKVAATH